MLLVDPGQYENDKINVDYILGECIYLLSVRNNTDETIEIYPNSITITSVRGQSAQLYYKPLANILITPGSVHILKDYDQPVLFDDFLYMEDRGYDKYKGRISREQWEH